ncbi:MAG TPA: hypothetical protein PLD37_06235 [Usitatibacteraceae bacterium]|nr:hypothetical protein [Usitatibacteraceae bacterium]
MKAPIIAYLALALVAAGGCGKKGPTDEQVIAEARKYVDIGCRRSAAKIEGLTANEVDRFCACATDKVIGIMGVDGLRGLATRGEPGEAVQEQMRAAGKACGEQLR